MSVDEKTKAICIALLHANSEDSAIGVLKSHGLWENPKIWRDFGDNDNNYSTAGAQQSDPVAALVEKLVNSADARLTNECMMAGINPESDEAPRSVRQAVARFIERAHNISNDTVGRIENWTATERRENAKKITLAATGLRGSPCFSIADSGEGQTPDAVPNTFMSLNKSNKLRTPFVHGKFNMGGTGVFRFCGERSLQLLITRRNPAILASEKDGEMWSFTVVRRDDPTGGERSSVYRYLAPVDATDSRMGGVLRFKSDTLPIFPDANQAYAREAEYGSLIKLYNYKVKGRSNILMRDGLLSAVGVRLPNPALTIMFHECRDYEGKAGSFNTPFTGLVVRLSDDKTDNLEEGFPYSEIVTVNNQKLTVRVFGFKQGKAETYRSNADGVLFVVNGQTHGMLHSRFFGRNSVKLGNVADSLLAYVDCSEMDRRSQEELFMNTRESLADSEMRREIEKALERAFRSNPTLREFANKRRQEKLKNKLDNDKPLEETLKTIMQRSPSLASLFLRGERLSDAFKSAEVAPSVNFTGKEFPTFFRFSGKPSGFRLARNCEYGRSARIKFETDVESNYFGRPKEPGTYAVSCRRMSGGEQVPLQNHRMNLSNGTATLTVDLPASVHVGEQVVVELIVNDDNQTKPFLNVCDLTLVVKTERDPTQNPHVPKPPSDKPGEGQTAPSSVALPNATWVHEAEWETYGFDKFSGVKIEQVPTDDERRAYDFYVNADNFYLLNELKRAPIGTAGALREQFKVGMVLIGLALIHDSPESEDSDALASRVQASTRALSMMILPIINLLGDLNEDVRDTEYEIDQEDAQTDTLEDA
jgi:hypothetical protein